MPDPKWLCHIRFTATRAVSGFVGLAIASASSSRPAPCVNGLPSESTVKNRCGTSSPRFAALPPMRTRSTFIAFASSIVW